MPNDADLLEPFYRYTDGAPSLRKKMLVDNRPGGNTVIGTQPLSRP
jgi:hypothetical protein